jgi:hypothetical protein
VDPRVGLDDVEKKKFLPYRDSNSDPSVVQPVASRYTNCAIPAPYSYVSGKSRDTDIGLFFCKTAYKVMLYHGSSSRWAFFLVGWDLRHQVLRPLLAYCTAPNDT